MCNFSVSALEAEPVQSTVVARCADGVPPPASDALESTRDGGNGTPSWTTRTF